MGVYAFAARSIQKYIFASGRLIDTVGASRLIDEIARDGGATGKSDDLVSRYLPKTTPLRFARRAGGALVVQGDGDALTEFRRQLTLGVQRHCPGLAFADGLSFTEDAATALHEAERMMFETTHSPISTPLLPAGAMVTPRTGAWTIRHDEKRGREPLDEPTAAKRRMLEGRNDGPSPLERRMLAAVDDGMATRAVFPRNMEDEEGSKVHAFPFNGRNRTVGLLHADGNALGQRFIKLLTSAREKGQEPGDLLRAISHTISAATDFAVAQAVRKVILPAARKCDGFLVLPMRPLVVGGDDVSVLLRGDLALPFARVFLQQFQEKTAAELPRDALAQEAGFGGGLTAGAGLVFCTASYPFDRAYELTEEVAAHAKSGAVDDDGNERCTLSLLRMTASHLDEEAAHEAIAPLVIHDLQDMSRFDAIVAALDDNRLPTGSLREICAAYRSDSSALPGLQRRFRQVTGENIIIDLFGDDDPFANMGLLEDAMSVTMAVRAD